MKSKNVKELSSGQMESVARLFGVLSEPSRLSILQILHSGSLTVGEIVGKTGMKQANVSKQLGILYDARLLAKTREGNWIRYSISDPRIFQLCEVVCGKIKDDANRAAKMF